MKKNNKNDGGRKCASTNCTGFYYCCTIALENVTAKRMTW